VFLAGPQPLKDPGNDGLVNTADDATEAVEKQPGPDGVYGTSDDISMTNYTRTILISNLTQDDGTGINSDLRMITVHDHLQRRTGDTSYVLTTYVSRIS
jgi:hypothetical protein